MSKIHYVYLETAIVVEDPDENMGEDEIEDAALQKLYEMMTSADHSIEFNIETEEA